MMLHLSIYDMDKTITARATFFPFVRHVIRADARWRVLLLPLMGVTSLLFVLRLMSRARLKEVNLRLLMGPRIDRARMARIAEGFADETLATNCLAPALERIAEERAQGRRIVLATASYRLYVDAIATRLGIDDVIATECQSDDTEAWRPIIAGENCYGAAKLVMVKAWMASAGLDRSDADIRFYSDHVSDAPCLDWADQAYACTPHPPLRTLANARGWTVFDWA